jgi:MFS transporter, OPA family, glycerol-3-phosphate transporter
VAGVTFDGAMNARLRFRSAQRRMLLATMLCYAFYNTGRHVFGFAMPGIEAELGINKTSLGWISSGLLWAYAIGQAINGNLGDRFGGRRMMTLGALFSCLTCWVVSFGSSFAGLMVPWSVNGYFQAMGWAPGSRLLSNWWGHGERGRAYGFYVFAAGLSSIITYVAAAVVITELGLSWRWLFRLPVLLMLAAGAVYYLVVRDRPEDLGFVSIKEEVGSDADHDEPFFRRYRSIFTEWRFVVACLAIGFQSIARYGLLVWIPVHFLGVGSEANGAGGWVSVALPVGMAFGAMFSGWISDRLFRDCRSRGITLFMALAAVAAVLMQRLSLQTAGGIVLLFLCGFFTYGPQTVFWALCPELLGSRRAGIGTGVMDMFAYVFAGVSEPLIGWAIQSHGDYTTLIFPIVAVSCLVSALIAVFVRR